MRRRASVAGAAVPRPGQRVTGAPHTVPYVDSAQLFKRATPGPHKQNHQMSRHYHGAAAFA